MRSTKITDILKPNRKLNMMRRRKTPDTITKNDLNVLLNEEEFNLCNACGLMDQESPLLNIRTVLKWLSAEESNFASKRILADLFSVDLVSKDVKISNILDLPNLQVKTQKDGKTYQQDLFFKIALNPDRLKDILRNRDILVELLVSDLRRFLTPSFSIQNATSLKSELDRLLHYLCTNHVSDKCAVSIDTHEYKMRVYYANGYRLTPLLGESEIGIVKGCLTLGSIVHLVGLYSPLDIPFITDFMDASVDFNITTTDQVKDKLSKYSVDYISFSVESNFGAPVTAAKFNVDTINDYRTFIKAVKGVLTPEQIKELPTHVSTGSKALQSL